MTAMAIETKGLGKSYQLGLHQTGNLRESLANAAKNPLGLMRRGKKQEADLFWALRDLTIEIADGDVVGLIGHNGAGKSTFLKLISRITEPSAGYADVTGRVGSLLEVGTGFHPELTGRENIFLNGAILGMRRQEIRERFDAIVEFAEVARFLDTPVKRYSSGMSVRLAFAVAAHLEPEILLVDEVLSVGDAAFQRRSLTKMSEVAKEGRTVVFVSHNLGTIRTLCERGILLKGGQVVVDTSAEAAIDQYLHLLEEAASDDLLERQDRDPRGVGLTRIKRVFVTDLVSGQRDVIIGGRPARITVEVTDPLETLDCRILIMDNLGLPLTRLDSEISAPSDERSPELGNVIECELPMLPLMPGRYRIDVRVNSGDQVQDGLDAAAYFDVEPGMIEGRPMHTISADGNLVVPHTWHLPE
jgi:homopolymeric O-antigen transport system ATP-binding protein